MKLLIIMLLSIQFVNSQVEEETIHSKGDVTINKTTGEKQRVGEWKHYKGEVLLSVENYNEGKLNGFTMMYFPNGQMKSKENYINNLLSGESIYYYSNGDIERIVIYTDGEEELTIKKIDRAIK